MIVPLDEGGQRAEPAHRFAVEVPDLVANRSVVGVEQVGPVVGVSGEVDLADAVAREPGQVVLGPEAVVCRADEDVVDVEQDATIGLLGDGGKELPFRHRRVPEGDVARDVLEQEAAPEPILDLTHTTDDMVDRLVGVGERQQIVRVAMAVAAPAQVIRYPGRLDARDQLAELAEILAVERVGRADRERDPVQDHGGVHADALEHGERAATAHHEVLRDDLEPVGALAVEYSWIVLGTEADAVPQLLAVGKHPDAGPRRAAGAHLISADDLAVLLLALGLRHDDHSLSLAGVLAGAAATGAGARALALALVDAGALHLVAARLVLGTDLHRAAGEERRRRGGDEDALAHSIHRLLLPLPARGEAARGGSS